MAGQNGHQPDGEPRLIAAFIEEAFVPGEIQVVTQEAQADSPPFVLLKQYTGSVGPGVFMFAKTARLQPDVAVRLGEWLVKEGNRVKTGLVIPGLGGLPGDLRGEQ